MNGGQLAQMRENAPETIGTMARIMFDNPRQFAMIGALAIVTGRALGNLVRPRTAVEALATAAVGTALDVALIRVAIDRGWVKFDVRDTHGCKVPYVPDTLNSR